MGKDNKTFLTLTIITAIISLNVCDVFTNSFFNNILTLPLWLLVCAFGSSMIFIIPYFIIDYFSESVSSYFSTINKKTKRIICCITIIVVWLILSVLGTYIN